MNDARNLGNILDKIVQQVQKELQVNLPRKVGIIAKNHFTDNFRKAGFDFQRILVKVVQIRVR